MLLATFGDLHFRSHWFQFVAELVASRKYDAICLTGDFLDMHPRAKVALQQQAEWVLDWFEKLPTDRTKIFAVSGNHDLLEGAGPNAGAQWLQRARRPGIAVDGDSVLLGGIHFVCRPWIGEIEIPSEGAVVLLAHAPPDETEVSRSEGSDAGGDFSVRIAAENLQGRRAILASAHCHTADAWLDYVGDVVCFNPGCDFGARTPNHVLIDPVRRRAHLVTAAGLHGPLRF